MLVLRIPAQRCPPPFLSPLFSLELLGVAGCLRDCMTFPIAVTNRLRRSFQVEKLYNPSWQEDVMVGL